MADNQVDQAAVGQFLAGAGGQPEHVLRVVLVRMTEQMAGNTRPSFRGERVSLATMQAVVNGLRAMLPK